MFTDTNLADVTLPVICPCTAEAQVVTQRQAWNNATTMDTATIREWATDAIRYWEPRRVVYNAVLAAIVITYFAIGLPSSKQLLNLNFVLFLFLLAVLANVCYCAAYLVDIFAQTSGFRELWQRYRWLLFVVGTVFAGIITRFWSLAFFTLPPEMR